MTFNDVCSNLNLENMQDWGIINSDALRVEEFIDYVYQHEDLQFSIKYNFVELIIASMNDALVEEKYNWQLIVKFCRYIKPILYNDEYYPKSDYWIDIKNETEYPIGFLLESLKEISPKPID